jgi:hypothetical protein
VQRLTWTRRWAWKQASHTRSAISAKSNICRKSVETTGASANDPIQLSTRRIDDEVAALRCPYEGCKYLTDSGTGEAGQLDTKSNIFKTSAVQGLAHICRHKRRRQLPLAKADPA